VNECGNDNGIMPSHTGGCVTEFAYCDFNLRRTDDPVDGVSQSARTGLDRINKSYRPGE
jgi:hypothetical protein